MSNIAKTFAEAAEKALEERVKLYTGDGGSSPIVVKEDDINTSAVLEYVNDKFSEGVTAGDQNIADFQVNMKIAGNTASLMRDYRHATVDRITRAASILNRMTELSENTAWTAAIAGASEKD